MALALAWPASASAATITVTNTNDSGPGSLRQAIATAATGDTIIVPAGTYTLTTGALVIDQSLTIEGPAGASSTIIDGNGAGRVFDLSGAPSGSNIAISGLTIRDGNAPLSGDIASGGGIFNYYANLTLSQDSINGNTAIANGAGSGGRGGVAGGGGVFSKYGTLTLLDTQVFANVASANGNSGQDGGISQGAGLESLGPLVIDSSSFSFNSAVALGGTGATAGGISDGGGLYATAGTITAATFNGNRLDTSGGTGGIGGISQGGAVFVLTMNPETSLVNVTATANVAQTTAGGSATGGGLYYSSDASSPITLTNGTVSDNSATGAAAGGNQGGNAFLSNVSVENTIISDGVGDAGAENCAGAPTSAGHNLDSLDQCDFHSAGDLVNTDPSLGPLQDNGGPVQTMALKQGSPAIDGGSNVGCPATDARGVLRPAGNACDIGAYELATPAASTEPATSTALNGVASNPDLLAGTAFFQYGSTTAYGSSTPAQPVPATTAHDAISAPLPTDAPGVYHFRLVVVNSVGMVVGSDQTFTIAPASTITVAPQLGDLKVRRHKHSERISFTDTAAGTCTFVFERRVHHRWVRVGRRFHHATSAGDNSFSVRRRLAPGVYRLLAVPTANGLTGREVIVRLQLATARSAS